jgi:hypothetical protein
VAKILGMHVYGTADDDNPKPVAKGGMRGERSAEQDTSGPTFGRRKRLAGHDVVIEETSGVTYAEAVLEDKELDGP